MTLRRLATIIAIFSVLSVGTVTPKPVHADDTAVIIIASIAAYVAFVFIGAYLVYGREPSPALMPAPGDVDQPWAPSDDVRFVHRCPQAAGGLTLACW